MQNPVISLLERPVIGVLSLLWHAIRLPCLALLIVLEPLVRVVLAGFALIGTLMAFLLEFATTLPDFPFWGMLAVSLGCVGILALYYGLIRLLSAS
jgi:hypothetical protein